DQSNSVISTGARLASTTPSAAAITSLPMPSPGTTAIFFFSLTAENISVASGSDQPGGWLRLQARLTEVSYNQIFSYGAHSSLRCSGFRRRRRPYGRIQRRGDCCCLREGGRRI